MNEKNFEGTLVLEKLAAIDRLEAFFEAVDADDFSRAATLMKLAGIDAQTLSLVLKKMAEGEP